MRLAASARLCSAHAHTSAAEAMAMQARRTRVFTRKRTLAGAGAAPGLPLPAASSSCADLIPHTNKCFTFMKTSSYNIITESTYFSIVWKHRGMLTQLSGVTLTIPNTCPCTRALDKARGTYKHA